MGKKINFKKIKLKKGLSFKGIRINKRLQLKSIKLKMLSGFSIVILLVLLFGIYNIISVNKVNKNTERIVDVELQLLIADEQLVANMANSVSAANNYILTGLTRSKDKFYEYEARSKEYEEVVLKLSESKQLKDLIERTKTWRNSITEDVFENYDKNEDILARMNLSNLDPVAVDIMSDYEKLAKEKEVGINKAGKAVITSGTTTITVVFIVTILVVLASIGSALITSNMISNPIKKVMERMKLIANGDLSQEPLVIHSQDEIGHLVDATNVMNENTHELLKAISEVSESVTEQSEELTQSANEVNAGSGQIAITMQELASGSETQATNASDLASNMTLFSTKVEEANSNGESIQNASNEVLSMTGEGSHLMESSSEQMAKIDSIVQAAVEKVQGLDVKSQQISKLVGVIQDIAAQTNLLALNAAIEAARAGEHGRGFAVVADEVRKLAEQVSHSVTDITHIVADIQNESSVVTESLQDGYEEVTIGTSQIKTTQATFTGISSAVQDMAKKINVVSDNLAEMATNSQKMNESITEIAAVSEESAAGAEQTSAASQQINSSMEEVAASSMELSQLAERLNGLVGKFKL